MSGASTNGPPGVHLRVNGIEFRWLVNLAEETSWEQAAREFRFETAPPDETEDDLRHPLPLGPLNLAHNKLLVGIKNLLGESVYAAIMSGLDTTGTRTLHVDRHEGAAFKDDERVWIKPT